MSHDLSPMLLLFYFLLLLLFFFFPFWGRTCTPYILVERVQVLLLQVSDALSTSLFHVSAISGLSSRLYHNSVVAVDNCPDFSNRLSCRN